MATLTRDLYIPLLDANSIRKAIGQEPTDSDYDWVRIDKSTIFALSFNPQEETYGFIDTANDTTYVKSYQPELPQEIILDNSNPLYTLLHPFCLMMPTGSNAEIPLLLVTPNMETGAATEGRIWKANIVSPGELNTVDGKLSFTNKMNGDQIVGTVTHDSGKIKFVEAEAASVLTVAGNAGVAMKTPTSTKVKE